jgi:transcriptional regulator with XRE-family HTH domain
MYDLNHIYKVGNLISKLREEKGFSQSELGSKLGVTNKAVSRWENGRGYPDTSILLKLAEVLEITVDELLKGELSISKPKHEVINKNINYEAEKTLFLRFLTTTIPFAMFLVWFVFFFIDSFNLLKYLDYGETWVVTFFLPAILSTVANVILGIFFTLQIHKRKDIKISTKLLISIATFIGSGLYYLAIFIYMLVRLLKAKKTNLYVN